MNEFLMSFPGLAMIVMGLVAFALPYPARQVAALVAIAASAWGCWQLGSGELVEAEFIGIELIPLRTLDFTRAFAVVFHIAAALGVIYALGEKARKNVTVATLFYAGAAIAALYKGDFLTLFIYWEIMTFASVLLVLAGNTEQSFRAAMHYLGMQLLSGVLLLAGAGALYQQSGSLLISNLSLDTMGGALIFLAFGIKAAFPLLNAWMQDAYSEASASGTVILSAFTTKLAVYMLLVCFVGEPSLLWIGGAMAVLGVVFTVFENDLRRLLAFSLNAQLGFMVAGVGIGSALAVNGVVAHAFASVIYHGLLFMAAGAVLVQAGKYQTSFRAMPLTFAFCVVGALSISSMPLFAGFTTKSLTIAAANIEGLTFLWLALLLATCGTLAFTGLKVPYLAFFRGKQKKKNDAPLPMLIAMGTASFLSLVIGLFASGMGYNVWTIPHLFGKTGTTLILTLAVVVALWKYKLLPPMQGKGLPNSDWFYRSLAPRVIAKITEPVLAAWHGLLAWCLGWLNNFLSRVEELHERSNLTSGAVETGIAAGVMLAVLSVILALRYFL